MKVFGPLLDSAHDDSKQSMIEEKTKHHNIFASRDTLREVLLSHPQ